MLNREKLRKHIEESKKRCNIASSFQEPDRVPIHISEYGSYWSKLFGYNIRDYYTNPEIMVEVQEKGLTWRFENLKDDRIYDEMFFEIPPIGEALVFDCPIDYPDDTSPSIVPILKDISDIENLKIIEPSKNPRIKWYLEKFNEFKKIAEKKKTIFPVVKNPFFGINAPLSAACAIMEPTLVYTYLCTEPELIKKLLDKMLQGFLKLTDYFDALNNTKRNGIGICDDNSCSISAEMYRDMIVKYNRAIYESYDSKWRGFHADGPNDHLFPIIAEELKLTSMDIGGFSNMDMAVKHLKGKTVIHGGLNNKDLYQGFTNETKLKIDNTIKIAAPGGGFVFTIGGETYPGVLPEVLIELVEYVKEKGKYPKK